MDNRQLEHNEIQNRERVFPLTVICENIESPENIGMVFRICESMGVEKIFFSGSSITPPNRKITKVSRSTDKSVLNAYCKSTVELIEKLKADGYEILALEITKSSKNLSEFKFETKRKYALIIGSEKHGVTADTLNSVDSCIEIKLFGKNTSINVVSALSISLYEITKQIIVG